MAPFREALLGRADLRAGLRVVDVGCGGGSVVRRAAEVCGDERVRGVDVSEASVDLARRLAAEEGARVEFVLADAESWDAGEVDRVLSRFGIMFFTNPEAAFANIRSWLAPEGTLTALCWQGRELNAWVAEPFELLAGRVDVPGMMRGGSGPHSLADPDRVCSLLTGAGFGSVALEEIEVTMRVEGDEASALEFYCEWGPFARFFIEAPADVQSALRGDFEALVSRKHDGGGLDLVARAWAIGAR